MSEGQFRKLWHNDRPNPTLYTNILKYSFVYCVALQQQL